MWGFGGVEITFLEMFFVQHKKLVVASVVPQLVACLVETILALPIVLGVFVCLLPKSFFVDFGDLNLHFVKAEVAWQKLDMTKAEAAPQKADEAKVKVTSEHQCHEIHETHAFLVYHH